MFTTSHDHQAFRGRLECKEGHTTRARTMTAQGRSGGRRGWYSPARASLSHTLSLSPSLSLSDSLSLSLSRTTRVRTTTARGRSGGRRGWCSPTRARTLRLASPGPGCVSSSCSGPEDPLFRALSGRLKFSARRYQFNNESVLIDSDSLTVEDFRLTRRGTTLSWDLSERESKKCSRDTFQVPQ